MSYNEPAPPYNERAPAYNDPGAFVSDKGFVPAILLCFFLGTLGIHRFYVGKIGTGILMLLTFGGLGIWTIIDFVLIAVGSFRDAQGRELRR